MPKVVLEIEKEDLREIYYAYRSRSGFSPQCVELQRKQKEQEKRITELILPLIK